MAGRSRVDHHEPVIPFMNCPRKCTENCNLLGTRRSQVFFEKCAAVRVQVSPTLRHHFGPICLNFRNRVDPANAKVSDRLGYGVENVSCGIGGGEVHTMSHCCQSNCDLSCNSRLSDSAFSHSHDDALAGDCDVREQCTYVGRQLDILRCRFV